MKPLFAIIYMGTSRFTRRAPKSRYCKKWLAEAAPLKRSRSEVSRRSKVAISSRTPPRDDAASYFSSFAADIARSPGAGLEPSAGFAYISSAEVLYTAAGSSPGMFQDCPL